jgi:hypothetical protein
MHFVYDIDFYSYDDVMEFMKVISFFMSMYLLQYERSFVCSKS